MKRLFLLRHCEALPSQGAHDKDRHLSTRGHEQAKALGKAMQESGYTPQTILCSAATRTRQTFEGLSESFSALDIDFKDHIYTASTGELFTMIQEISDDIQQLMIIAHNPSIYELSLRLCGSEKPTMISKLGMGYAPGSLSVIDIVKDKWADIQLGENILENVISPSDYHRTS